MLASVHGLDIKDINDSDCCNKDDFTSENNDLDTVSLHNASNSGNVSDTFRAISAGSSGWVYRLLRGSVFRGFN